MLRVMIVEDEDMIRKGLVFTIDWLSMDCVVVAEASNGPIISSKSPFRKFSI